MKKVILMALSLVVLSCSLVFAEASFEQIQGLIKEQNYSAAVKGLEMIIQNHPKSAKAYYAMSQAQAGLGNQAKAKEALDIATGIDPSLKFASSDNVENLKEALTPQTKKIEVIESHTARNVLIALFILGGIGVFFVMRKKKGDTIEHVFGKPSHTPEPMAMRECTDYVHPPKANTVKTEPMSAPKHQSPVVNVRERDEHVVQGNYQYTPERSVNRAYTPAPTTTVINNGGGSGDLLTGVLVGSMLSGGSPHDHTTVVEREVIREEPSYTPSRSSRRVEEEDTPSRSWDTPSSSSISSSWDDTPSSSSSSSWDSGSSSSSSSSWDSGSSSSSSDSSSSWD